MTSRVRQTQKVKCFPFCKNLKAISSVQSVQPVDLANPHLSETTLNNNILRKPSNTIAPSTSSLYSLVCFGVGVRGWIIAPILSDLVLLLLSVSAQISPKNRTQGIERDRVEIFGGCAAKGCWFGLEGMRKQIGLNRNSWPRSTSNIHASQFRAINPNRNFTIFMKTNRKLTNNILRIEWNLLGLGLRDFCQNENSPTALFFFCLLICQIKQWVTATISQNHATFHHNFTLHSRFS